MPEYLMGYQIGDEIAINARDRRSERLWRGTLLHEMVHMELPDQIHHGKKFEVRMVKLANSGAFKGIW